MPDKRAGDRKLFALTVVAAAAAYPIAVAFLLAARSASPAESLALFVVGALLPALGALFITRPWRSMPRPPGALPSRYAGRPWIHVTGSYLLLALGTVACAKVSASVPFISAGIAIGAILLAMGAVGLAWFSRVVEAFVTGEEVIVGRAGVEIVRFRWDEVVRIRMWDQYSKQQNDRFVAFVLRGAAVTVGAKHLFDDGPTVTLGEASDLFWPAFPRFARRVRGEAAKRPEIRVLDEMGSLK